VESVQRDTTSESNLIIFLHGYPDSYALWKHYLQNPRLAVKATMIAVDLPGFGGSDSFEKYRPADVLEAITEFILKMREQHLTVGSGKVVVVSHDWGGIIGFRLAAEAPQLADRFVMANVIHPPLAVANVKSRLSTTKQMFKTWLRSPLNFRLLRRAFSNIAPLFRQMYKSGERPYNPHICKGVARGGICRRKTNYTI
jgi:pimeloyl-ACP methyl ester carboxylesterase